MRIVLDNNVLLSAFASRGLCEAVMEACLAAHDVVGSEYILAELDRHLRSKLRFTAEQANLRVQFLREHTLLVKPVSVPLDACRDAKDLPILGTALAGRADYIVTGDADLLELRQYQGIAILSPRGLHERLV